MPMEGFLLPRTSCSSPSIGLEQGLACLTGWGDLFQLAAPGDLPKRLNRRSAMALKYITENGVEIHGPPYTKAEEAEFYRRNGGGPKTMFAPKQDKPPAPAPDRQQRPQGKRRAPRHHRLKF
jgi:hypothetical protein